MTPATVATTLPGMSLPPDPPPPPEPKLTAGERRIRHEDRLRTIRPHMAIGRKLDERGITTPVAVGTALGMPAAEAVKLLTRHRWREGDVALLEVAAARLWLIDPACAVTEIQHYKMPDKDCKVRIETFKIATAGAIRWRTAVDSRTRWAAGVILVALAIAIVVAAVTGSA